MTSLFKIGTYNNISRLGLERFSQNLYQIGALDKDNKLESPMGILLRSHKLKNKEVDKSVSAIARCGAGTNNIPIDEMTKRGIAVFNTPGANANSVKELVLCSLFISSRNIVGGINHIQNMTDLKGFKDVERNLEKDKKLFAGTEIKGKTLGVIGLGSIGAKVAMACSSLGMNVIGYDPNLTVESAWDLNGENIKRVNDIESCISSSDYVTLHVPMIKGVTDNLIDEDKIKIMKPGANLLNFSRSELVDHSALRNCIENGIFNGIYCSDFPNKYLQGYSQYISIPHLGASTKEAEDNSAAMASETIIDFFENGSIKNSVNFPTTELKKRKKDTTRICIVNENKGGMLMKINNLLYEEDLNIDQQINTSRDEIAYNVIDIDTTVEAKDFTKLHNQLEKISGILSVRIITGSNRDEQSYRSSKN